MEKSELPGVPAKPDEDRLVLLGVISKPQGIKGGVRMIPQFDDPDDFEFLKTDRLFLKSGATPGTLRPRDAHYREVTLSEFNDHQRFIVLYFDGVNDMNAAEAYRNLEVYVYEDELWDLEEGQYYAFQLVGLEVFDVQTEKSLGKVKELRPGTQNYLVVEGPAGEILVPYVPEIVQQVDLATGRITANLPPGLDEL